MYILEIKGVKPTDVKLYPVESGKENPKIVKNSKSGKKSTCRDVSPKSDYKNNSPKCEVSQCKSENKQKDQKVTKPTKRRGCCFMACCSSDEKDETRDADKISDDKPDDHYKKPDVCPKTNKEKKPREVPANLDNKNKPKKLDEDTKYKPRNQGYQPIQNIPRKNKKSTASRKKEKFRNRKVPDSDVNEVAVEENETEINGHGIKKCDSDCEICNPKVGYCCNPFDNCCCKLLCIRRKLNKKGPMKAGATQTDNILIEIPLEIKKDCGCEPDKKQNLTVAISMTGIDNKNEYKEKKMKKTYKIK